jgi:predicted metal-dependent peptidase
MSNSEVTNVALSALLTSHPFFASIMYSTMKLVESEEHDTAATDGKTMWVNPTWFKTLTVSERVFVICHEIGHGMFLHMARGKVYADRGVGPNHLPYDPKQMNIAMDYVINAMLIENKVGTMPKKGCLNKAYDSTWLVDDVYNAIYQKPDDKDGTGGHSPEGGEGFDEHKDPADGSGPSEADKANMETAIKQAAQSAKAQGKLPSTMNGLIDSLLNPKVKWEELLMQEMTSTLNRDHADWKRPNRRRLVLPQPVILPSMRGTTCGTIIASVDISGSIGMEEKVMFLTEVKSICEEQNPEEIYIMWVNSGIAHVDHIEEMAEFDDVLQAALDGKRPSGGGTDIEAVHAYIAEWGIEPATCVHFTDGYTSFTKAPPFPVIWAMTTDNIAPYGATIRVDV